MARQAAQKRALPKPRLDTKFIKSGSIVVPGMSGRRRRFNRRVAHSISSEVSRFACAYARVRCQPSDSPGERQQSQRYVAQTAFNAEVTYELPTEAVALVRQYILGDEDIQAAPDKFVEGWGWDHTKWAVQEFPTAVRQLVAIPLTLPLNSFTRPTSTLTLSCESIVSFSREKTVMRSG